jgi:hypothetical protein
LPATFEFLPTKARSGFFWQLVVCLGWQAMLAAALSKYDSSSPRTAGQDDNTMSAAALARLVVRGDDSGRVIEPGGEALDETFITATLALDAQRRTSARELEIKDSPFQGAIDDAKDKFIDLVSAELLCVMSGWQTLVGRRSRTATSRFTRCPYTGRDWFSS